ncbi:MAG: hypothetical protein CFH44_00265 [Proteobacteria bacterium]|nr:MAG: hypothetical protein CFH44_00265 [Pseudomonadota bacterium]
MKKLLILAAFVLFSVNADAQSLSRALTAKMDYLIARQNVVSGNIANASTPGYLAQDINYNPSRKTGGGIKMAATNSKHIGMTNSLSRYGRTQDTTFIRNDGNSVRVDEQMLKMAQIQQEYTMATRLFTKHMGMQKMLVQK